MSADYSDEDYEKFVARIEKMNAQTGRHRRWAMRVNLAATLVFAGCFGYILSRLVDRGDLTGLGIGIVALIANAISHWSTPPPQQLEDINP